MKLLVDMNLSPQWAHFLSDAGIEAVHWSEVECVRSAPSPSEMFDGGDHKGARV